MTACPELDGALCCRRLPQPLIGSRPPADPSEAAWRLRRRAAMLVVAQRSGAKLVKELCAHGERRHWATTPAVRTRWRVLDLADKLRQLPRPTDLASSQSHQRKARCGGFPIRGQSARSARAAAAFQRLRHAIWYGQFGRVATRCSRGRIMDPCSRAHADVCTISVLWMC